MKIVLGTRIDLSRGSTLRRQTKRPERHVDGRRRHRGEHPPWAAYEPDQTAECDLARGGRPERDLPGWIRGPARFLGALFAHSTAMGALPPASRGDGPRGPGR